MTRDEARQEIREQWEPIIRTITRPAKKAGEYVCPFCGHGKGGDGLKINPRSRKPGGLKCFGGGCDFSGDIIDLVMQEKGLPYIDAINYCAAVLGLTIESGPQDAQRDRQSRENPKNNKTHADKEKKAEKAPDATTDAEQATAEDNIDYFGDRQTVADYRTYYDKCRERINDPAAVSYLKARGISRETAEIFCLGYDPEWISPTVTKNQRAKGDEWLPPATPRIIIPVSNNHYVARAADPAIKDYAKMNETGGGDIGIFRINEFYNSHNEYVFITEGVFDALAVFEAGSAAVALNSANNAGKLIARLEEKPTAVTAIICLDDDTAGRKAADVLAAGLDRLNVNYIKADISCGYKDPNEALIKDPAAFRRAILDTQEIRPHNVARYISSFMGEDMEKNAVTIKTGYPDLDDKLAGGLEPGLYAVGAISSLGKTTFCHQMADSIAAAGHEVLFFSLEQSRLELVSKSFARMIAEENKIRHVITSRQIRKGKGGPQVKAAAEKYLETVGDRLSIIEGNFKCDISFIGDYIRTYMKKTDETPIVFIDYLQILKPSTDKRQTTTKEAIDDIVTELRRLSRELSLTIVIVSSFNRQNYMTPADYESFKESGGIEYTADCVMGLQLACLNEDLFNQNNKIKEKRERIKKAKRETPRKVELVCLKNRGGVPNFSCYFDYYPAADLFISILPEEKKDQGTPIRRI